MLNLNFSRIERGFQTLEDHVALSNRMALYNEVFKILTFMQASGKNMMGSGMISRKQFTRLAYGFKLMYWV